MTAALTPDCTDTGPMDRYRAGIAALAAVACLLLTACSAAGEDGEQPEPSDAAQSAASPASSPAPSPTPDAPRATPTPVPVADAVTGLQSPWSIAVVDGSRALVSQRNSGDILLLSNAAGTWEASTAGRIDGVAASGEGGLLGLAVAPSGDAVFAMHTSAVDNRVVRMSWDGARLGAPDPVLTGIAKADFHNGGRLAFGPDGMLYISTGDAGVADRAQDRASLSGKILRVTPAGGVPSDNPFPGSPVFSLGHRNVQGLVFDDDGRLWASEFGNKDVDEVNLVRAGANYGWPVVEGTGSVQGMTNPVVTWSPTAVASPSGITYAQGSLWAASLRGETLYQVPMDGATAAEPIARFAGQYGRLRDVVVSPTGSLWLLTNNTDGRGSPRSGDDRIVDLRLERG